MNATTTEKPRKPQRDLANDAHWLRVLCSCSLRPAPDGDRFLWPEDVDNLLDLADALETIAQSAAARSNA